MERYFTRFLIVTGILIFLSVGYYYLLISNGTIKLPAKKSDQFSDWNTYDNKIYGIALKYPKRLYDDSTKGICGSRTALFNDRELISLAESDAPVEYKQGNPNGFQTVGRCGGYTLRLYISNEGKSVEEKVTDIEAKIKLGTSEFTRELITINGTELTKVKTTVPIQEVSGQPYEIFYIYYSPEIKDVIILYVDYRSEASLLELDKIASSFTVTHPVQAEIPQPPFYNQITSYVRDIFTTRQYATNADWFNDRPYPAILNTIPDTSLIGMKCTPLLYEGQGTTQWNYSYTAYNPATKNFENRSIADKGIENLYSFLRQNNVQTGIRSLIYCATETNREFVYYIKDTPLQAIKDSGFRFSEIKNGKEEVIVRTQYDGYYSYCNDPLLFTSSGAFYLSCGGGDMTSYSEIQRVNIPAKKIETLYRCTQVVEQDAGAECSAISR